MWSPSSGGGEWLDEVDELLVDIRASVDLTLGRIVERHQRRWSSSRPGKAWIRCTIDPGRRDLSAWSAVVRLGSSA